MSRAEGNATRPRERVEVEQLVDRVARVIAPRAEARGVRLEVRGAPASEGARSALSGDEEGLASALGNVLANAVRYTPAGGQVVVSCLLEREGVVVVQVDDSGPGVDAGEEERIFEPFRRGTAGSAPGADAGFGLGLSIAKRVLEQHEASLDVVPSPLGGARFRIAFSPGSLRAVD